MMRHDNTLFRRFLSRWNSESGSAITEMVMGLPVFIMIFSGMGMLYQFNQEALVVKAEAYKNLWQSDSDGSLLGMIPIVGAATSISSVGDVWQNGLSGAGIYVDSGVKAKIPAVLMPGSNINPKYSIGSITGGSDDMVNNRLLNDMINPTMNSGGFAQIVSSVLQTTGAGLALGAGIRYGAAKGSATVSKSSGVWGNIDYESGEIDLPARTAATHRLAAVALTRLEFSNTDRFDQSIPVFEMDPNFSNESTSEGDACSTQNDAYTSCLSANPGNESACESSQPSGDCASIGGSNPLGNFDMSWAP